MKAWQYDSAATPARLILNDVETPEPDSDKVLIQVHAAGVTPDELTWYPSTHQKDGTARQRAIPGHEFSGVVIKSGVNAGFRIGQEVFGMNDWFSPGAMAEFCCAPAEAIVLKPKSLTHEESASVPIGALTAWQGLFDHAQLQPGERVLIHGGSGSVGVFAVQFARQRGASVITTASARNREFLSQLGANQVIDYRTESFEEVAQAVDVVFDTVGGDTRERSWALLKPGGRLITIAPDVETQADERTQKAFFIVTRDRKQLGEIASQLSQKSLHTVVESVIPFASAGEAFQTSSGRTKGCGKVVVSVTLR